MQKRKSVLATFGAVAAGVRAAVLVSKSNSVYKNHPEEQNPFEGKRVKFVRDENDPVNADGERGHLEEIADLHNRLEGKLYKSLGRAGYFFRRFAAGFWRGSGS